MFKSSISVGLFVRVEGVSASTVTVRPPDALNHYCHNTTAVQNSDCTRAPAIDASHSDRYLGMPCVFINGGNLHG